MTTHMASAMRSRTGHCERSLREWAIRQGWDEASVRQEQAQGILVAALGVLAAPLGYTGRPGGPPEGCSRGLGQPLPDRRAETGSGGGDAAGDPTRTFQIACEPPTNQAALILAAGVAPGHHAIKNRHAANARRVYKPLLII